MSFGKLAKSELTLPHSVLSHASSGGATPLLLPSDKLFEKMADNEQRQRAKLADLPPNFSVEFLKTIDVSLKSKQLGFRYFSEGYIHDVNMYFGDHDDEENRSTIFTSAKCYRSMKQRENPHSLHLDIRPTEISFAHCSCQAGAGGNCSHIVGCIEALQQWLLMGFSEVPTKLSCTSLPEQWGIPRGTKIEPVDVQHIMFVNPKPDRKRKPLRNVLTDNRKVKVQSQDIARLNNLSGCPIGYLACNLTNTVNTHLGPVPVASGLSTHAKFFEADDTKSVGTTCGNLEFPQAPVVTIGHSYQDLVEDITKEQCVRIEETTRDQASCPLWTRERKNRLTASNFRLILKRKKVTEKFVNSILNPKTFSTVQTSYGTNQEDKAIEAYIKKTGNHVHKCGLVINPSFPFLGGTPDGKVCEDGYTGLIEVKCPYSARDSTIEEACALKTFCLESSGQAKHLKVDHAYYYQVQGQLMVSGTDFCDFVVYTRKDLFVQRIFPNIVFMQKMLDDLTDFFFKHIQPVLSNGQDLQQESV